MTTRRTPIRRKLFLLVAITLLCIYGFVAMGTPKVTFAANRGAWAAGVAYAVGDTVTYPVNGTNYTYTCQLAHTSQTGWEPPNVPALWIQGAASGGATAVPTATRTNTPVGNPPSATPVGNYPFGGTAANVPGTIEAENYDTAGSGVSYSDSDTVNSGGQYRNDYVDIEVTTDPLGGAYNVGWMNTGEWMIYTVNVTSTGSKTVEFRVASAQTGQLKLEDVTSGTTTLVATTNVPNTGGWQTWQSVTATATFNNTGYRKLKFSTVTTGFNMNYIKIYNAASATATFTPTASSGGFNETQFNTWFPNRNALYTYSNFQTARGTYTGFANTGNATNDKIEIAAFFAHVAHETSYLIYVDEQNYPVGHYEACGTYPCPAGADHHGRGPLQISWNYNYSMASDGMYYCWASCEGGTTGWKSRMNPTVGANIVNNPNLVSTDGIITWKTALWYWMNHGKDWDPAKATPHDHIAPGNLGFGETTRDINGGLECGQAVGSVGYNQMQDRANIYSTFLSNLGVSDSRTKTC